MVVLLCMTNISHNTNVEDLVTFGIAKTEFQNYKQSLMTERLVLDNTKGLKREDFPCLLKKSLEKECMNILNQSGWENSGVYNFYRYPFWCVHKLDIKSSAAALAAAGPLISPTKSSAPLIELNANAVDALTTDIATELSNKRRRAELTSDAQSDR